MISGGCGGGTVSERRLALRIYTEAPVRQGRLDSPWDRVVRGLVLGSSEFAARVLMPSGAEPGEDETGAWHAGTRRPDWTSIVKAAEKIGGQRWSEALVAHGNWIRDAVLFTAVRHLGHRLAEVYREIPGLKYPAAAAAVKRFGRMRLDDRERARFVGRLRRTLGR